MPIELSCFQLRILIWFSPDPVSTPVKSFLAVFWSLFFCSQQHLSDYYQNIPNSIWNVLSITSETLLYLWFCPRKRWRVDVLSDIQFYRKCLDSDLVPRVIRSFPRNGNFYSHLTSKLRLQSWYSAMLNISTSYRSN